MIELITPGALAGHENHFHFTGGSLSRFLGIHPFRWFTNFVASHLAAAIVCTGRKRSSSAPTYGKSGEPHQTFFLTMSW